MPSWLSAGRLSPRVPGELFDTWLDAVFPPRCAGCSRPGAHFCSRCVGTLEPVTPPWCKSCGRTVPDGDLCEDCRTDPLPLAAVRSAALLRGPLRRAIHRLKYRGRAAAGGALADLLVPVTPPLTLPAGSGRVDAVVVPVPLHPVRERSRGYNQAAQLAGPLARRCGLRCDPAALRRVRETAPQVGLSRRDRRRNLDGAFAAGPAVSGRAVYLVDDVITTGSTLGSAAEACLAAGAVAVYGVTLAREA